MTPAQKSKKRGKKQALLQILRLGTLCVTYIPTIAVGSAETRRTQNAAGGGCRTQCTCMQWNLRVKKAVTNLIEELVTDDYRLGQNIRSGSVLIGQ